jgi:hypothetical protein
MYYRYRPYPYYRRYYNLDPYYYRRYYNPYYGIYNSQIADVDQSIINYGDMNDAIQDSYIYQSRALPPTAQEENNDNQMPPEDIEPEPMPPEPIMPPEDTDPPRPEPPISPFF